MFIYKVRLKEDVIYCDSCLNDIDKDIQGNDPSLCEYLHGVILNGLNEICIVCGFCKLIKSETTRNK